MPRSRAQIAAIAISKRSIRKSRRKSKPRRSCRKSGRKSKSPRRRRISPARSRCNALVSSKIAINIKEYKRRRYTSRAQAIAVGYSQIAKRYPECKRYQRRS